MRWIMKVAIVTDSLTNLTSVDLDTISRRILWIFKCYC